MEENLKKSVLLITEDSMTEKIMSIVLGAQGINIRISNSAIGACRNELEQFSPSLIIYDLPDPRKSTLIPCASLNSFTGKKLTPQLVISTDRKDCENCDAHIQGRCVFFSKPFRISEVSEKLKKLI